MNVSRDVSKGNITHVLNSGALSRLSYHTGSIRNASKNIAHVIAMAVATTVSIISSVGSFTSLTIACRR
jgi:hypothetical protein